MLRCHRPVLGMLMALSLAVAGCGGATASPGTTGANSTAASPQAIVAASTAAVPPPTPSPTATPIPTPSPTPADPDALFTKAIAAGPAWKSFHLKMALGGSIKPAFLSQATDGLFGKQTSPLSIDGTVIEGDFDPPTLTCDVHITLPALTGLTTSPTAAEIIYKEPTIYFTLPVLNGKYQKIDLAQEAKDAHIAFPIPTAGGASLVGIADVVASFRKHLDSSGVVPHLVGVEQIGSRNAYRISLSVPLDKLNTDVAAALSPLTEPGTPALKVKVDSASSELWIYQDTYELAQVQLTGSSATAGNLTFTMTLTDFGKPVTITAPPPSAIAK